MNNLKEISRIFYILNFALIPFIVFPFSFSPSTLYKTLTLIFLTTMSLFFYIFSNPKKVNLPNNLFFLLILFELISNLHNFNLYLFPRYSEHIYISLIIYINIFLGINLYEKFNLEKIIVYSSPLVVLASFVDIFVFSGRSQGTLGQSNFLGMYLSILLLIFLNSFQILKQLNNYIKYLYIILIVILLVKSASLAAIFGFLFGLFLLREKILQIKKEILILMVILISAYILFYGSVLSAKFQDIYYQIFDSNNTKISDSFLIRRVLWSNTVNIFIKNPADIFIGFGPNTFSYNFEIEREESLSGFSENNLLYDKPHNYYIELIFNYGLFYLIIFTYILYKTIKNNKSSNYILIPILFFIFLNWLDIYYKLIIFSLIFLNLEKTRSYALNFFNKILIVFTSYIILIQFLNLTYNDIQFYFNNKNYFYSYNVKDIKSLKVQDPIMLVMFLNENHKNLEEEEKKKIIDFLIQNFPKNQAILFHLNKLL